MYLACLSGTNMYQSGRRHLLTYLVLSTDSGEAGGRQTAGVTKTWAGGHRADDAAYLIKGR